MSHLKQTSCFVTKFFKSGFIISLKISLETALRKMTMKDKNL